MLIASEELTASRAGVEAENTDDSELICFKVVSLMHFEYSLNIPDAGQHSLHLHKSHHQNINRSLQNRRSYLFLTLGRCTAQ